MVRLQEKVSTTKEKPWYYGHRARMQEKIVEHGVDSLTESELLEQLLTRAIPRRDVKPIVRELLMTFGSLAEVLCAPTDELIKVKGIKETTANFLKVIRRVSQQIALNKIQEHPVLSHWEQLLDYAQNTYTGETAEKLYILFLDPRLKLIRAQMHQVGSVNHIPVDPRDILKSALNLNASAVILMHNHPSGDPHPSKDDIIMTEKIQQALETVNIKLLEHLVIGANRKVNMIKLNHKR
ncbi:MAG: DNA repair protein RadC [Alphaproteobacteria bacterium]|nr:DNA repair protein RadC [Alphaproteobacteria bacterium]MBQ4471888.1 DNA repair protein RadC [Alphaproteobacteria bacterium]